VSFGNVAVEIAAHIVAMVSGVTFVYVFWVDPTWVDVSPVRESNIDPGEVLNFGDLVLVDHRPIVDFVPSNKGVNRSTGLACGDVVIK
ncbi:MAG: hypothetical protein ACKPKO_38375, partial [Candidatus Fonsibacter sp.]